MRGLYSIALSEYKSGNFDSTEKGKLKEGFRELFMSLHPQIRQIHAIHSLYYQDPKLGNDLETCVKECVRIYSLNVASLLFGDLNQQQVAKENITSYVTRTKQFIELLTESYHDRLTGLFNAKFLDNFPEKLLENYTIIYVDIDDFKRLNDTFGHAYGDEKLQELGVFFKSLVRTSRKDYVIRKHGDEFVLLIQTVEPEVIERVICEIQNYQGEFTLSIGYNNNVSDKKANRVHSADTAMIKGKYEKKGGIRGSIVSVA